MPGYGSNGASHSARVLKLELEAYRSLLEAIDTPRALTCAIMLRYGDYTGLLGLSCDPCNYDNPQHFADDYLVTSVLQKNPRLPTGIDKKQVALDKFYQAERLCFETNKRILDFIENQHSADPWIISVVSKIQHVIQRILSAYPSRLDLNFAEIKMRFGPGATTSLSGVVTQGAKYSDRTLDCTQDLVSFRAFAFPHQWKHRVNELKIVNGSKLTTVPKNAKTDRVICIEPDLNIFVQLGIGALLRDKLLKFGLDLQTQQRNQYLASVAWEKNLATVDLSSASDTIAAEVVKLLLPPAWVSLLAMPRCDSTYVDGHWVQLEKWSSMGNGYTFELETLIFYATAIAVAGYSDDIVAYGDDIIIPAESLPDLRRILDFLGFKVNEEKTFGTGIFHESCGTDWFMGQNVRPFYFRSDHHDFETICYLYANNARRWANRRNGGWSCDSRCLPLWLRCFRAVAPKDAHLIPEGYGDVGFISDFDRAKPSIRPAKRGWEGYRFSYRRIGSIEKRISEEGAYLAFLNGTRTDFKLAFESLRGRYSRAATRIGTFHEWPNLGPWL